MPSAAKNAAIQARRAADAHTERDQAAKRDGTLMLEDAGIAQGSCAEDAKAISCGPYIAHSYDGTSRHRSPLRRPNRSWSFLLLVSECAMPVVVKRAPDCVQRGN